MPGTINGIGTAYRGKRNASTRIGVCDHCHRQVPLESYETRLCFVVLFVPVLPLGRKQIIDACPVCTWHRSTSVAEWEQAGQRAVEEARRLAEEKPDDPEATVQLHATLTAFGHAEQAARVGEALAERFADDPDVQLYVGAFHAEHGQNDEADRHFARALKLAPDDLNAKRAVGIGRIEQGKLDEARKLLAFMESRCPEQDPGVLVLLGDAFQSAGDHEQALELYAIVLRDFPPLGQDGKLRKRVARSEKALGRENTLLPRRPFHRKPVFYAWLAAVAAVVLGMLYWRYVAEQPLQVVNGLAVPVEITFDGSDGPHNVPAGEIVPVRLAAGEHVARIERDGAEPREVEFAMRAGVWERMRGRAVFVLNVEGAADLIRQKIVYSARPHHAPPASHQVHFGREFFEFHGIDYGLDEEPPDELKGSEHTQRVEKTCLSVLGQPPAAALGAFPPSTPATTMMDYAEHHLGRNPADEMLVQFYHAIGVSNGQARRVRDFLATRLDHHPAAVEWHRAFQTVSEMTGQVEDLPARYDRMLAADPNDAALNYLRARIAATISEARPYLEKALEADPQNPYAHLALGYQLLSCGRFEEAREHAAEACRLKPDSLQMPSLLEEARLALGEYDELEKELRSQVQASPLATRAQQGLVMALGLDGRVADAAEAHRAFAEGLRTQLAQGAGEHEWLQRTLPSKMALQYVRGDLDGYLQSARQLAPANRGASVFAALVELKRPKEAEEALGEMAMSRVIDLVVLSLAWSERGDDAAAERWWNAAVEKLAAGAIEDRHFAALLERPGQVGLEEFNEYATERTTKAALAVAVAERSPEGRRDLKAHAAKLNVPGPSPYRFLKRRIEALAE